MLETLIEVPASGGCQGCFGVAIFGVFGVAWLITHRRQILHGGLSILVATVIVGTLYLALTRWLPQLVARRSARRALDPRAGPTLLADVRSGNVHTAGLVVGAALRAPIENTPCVYYAITVETSDGARVLYSARSADELPLGDGGDAKIIVKLERATWKIDREHVVADDRVATFLDARGVEHHGALRARITWIEAHELVFVRGDVASVGERAADYRANSSVELVMTAPTISLDDNAFGTS